MSEPVLVAVPSDEPGGVNATPSAHFGHCACYTVAKIVDGAIEDVLIVPNNGHAEGGCAAPVMELAQKGVQVLIAGGMGMRPMMALRQVGMKVYFSAGLPSVGAVLTAFADGKLIEFGDDNLCRGCGGHH